MSHVDPIVLRLFKGDSTIGDLFDVPWTEDVSGNRALA